MVRNCADWTARVPDIYFMTLCFGMSVSHAVAHCFVRRPALSSDKGTTERKMSVEHYWHVMDRNSLRHS